MNHTWRELMKGRLLAACVLCTGLMGILSILELLARTPGVVRAYNASGYSSWATPRTVEVRRYFIYLPLVLRN
jgi:hypothetical protein